MQSIGQYQPHFEPRRSPGSTKYTTVFRLRVPRVQLEECFSTTDREKKHALSLPHLRNFKVVRTADAVE